MLRLKCLFFALTLISSTLSQNLTENEEVVQNGTDAEKIFVHPSNNAINYLRPPRVKPTTKQVSFEPGVPPGPTRPTRSPTRSSLEVNSTTTRSETYPPGVSAPEPIIIEPDRGVVDWFLGLVGVTTGQTATEAPVYETGSPGKSCPSCRCGLTYKHNRIVGGVETQVNEYPWMAVLKYNNRFFCGASLINNKYVLTAGHCVNGFAKERLSVELLDHDRSTTYETQTLTRKVSRIIKHLSYGIGGSYNNDIAIVQLQEDVPMNGIVKPVCLPTIGKSFTGLTGIVTGWGATASHGQISNKLQEVRVPILSNEECRRTGYGYRITDNMMCAGYSYGTKDSCQGDSGGPLHIINGTTHTLAGIVSWGEGCAEPNYPGVYTRVNRYISWIMSNTRDACYC